MGVLNRWLLPLLCVGQVGMVIITAWKELPPQVSLIHMLTGSATK